MRVVLTTVPDSAEAEELAEKIIESKLAACVQILPQMTSVSLLAEKRDQLIVKNY